MLATTDLADCSRMLESTDEDLLRELLMAPIEELKLSVLPPKSGMHRVQLELLPLPGRNDGYGTKQNPY
jgi:hypothetical protein